MFNDNTNILFIDYKPTNIQDFAKILKENNAHINFTHHETLNHQDLDFTIYNLIIIDSNLIDKNLLDNTKPKKIPIIALTLNEQPPNQTPNLQYLQKTISPQHFLTKVKNIIEKINKKEQSISQNNVIVLEINCDKPEEVKTSSYTNIDGQLVFATQFIDNLPIPSALLDNEFNITNANREFLNLLNNTPLTQKNNLLNLFTDLPKNLKEQFSDNIFNYKNLTYLNFQKTKNYLDLHLWQFEPETILVTIYDHTNQSIYLRQIEDFVSTLIHDIKNPILSIDRIIDFLIENKNKKNPEELEEIFRHFKKSNESLIAILNNIADIAKFQSTLGFLNLNLRNTKSLITDAITTFSNDINAKNITVNTKLIDFETTLDEIAIKRVISNLLHNAIKFSQPNSAIDIESTTNDNHFEFSITNYNAHINEKEQKLLFNRLFQGKTGKLAKTGSGLGLYLCHQIISAHKGTITCSSNENHTTFKFTIPGEL